MLVFTHLEVGYYLFNRIKKNQTASFMVKPKDFIYGNILPDISEMARKKHYLSETYDLFLEQKVIAMDPNHSNSERSRALGIATHFLCDYFCLYHAKAPYKELSLLKHIIYESQLHISTVWYFWTNCFRQKHYLPLSPKFREAFNSMDIEILLEGYNKSEETLKTDVEFALLAIHHQMMEILGIKLMDTKVNDEQNFPDLQVDDVLESISVLSRRSA